MSRRETPVEALRELAVEVAGAAGRVLAEHARDRLEVDTKTSATDPVTQADRASERLIVDRLLRARPDDGIVGEEDVGDRAGTTGLRWVIDPLDATVNYTYRLPHWCVSVAAVDDDGPVAGAVVDPVRGEVFAAARGQGGTLGDVPLAVTEVADPAMTLVATGFGYDVEVRRAQGLDVADLVTRVRDVRRAGSAALDLAWVAAGRLDAYVEFGLQPWDWAAGQLLVTEAGGRATALSRRLSGQVRPGLVAGGAAAHDFLVDWAGARPGADVG